MNEILLAERKEQIESNCTRAVIYMAETDYCFCIHGLYTAREF